jgi:protein TonB
VERINTAVTPTPRLPHHGLSGRVVAVAVAAVLHGAAAGAVMAVVRRSPTQRTAVVAQVARATEISLPGIVFLPPKDAPGGGGGGGGNGQQAPIRRASGIGADKLTLRVRKPVAPAEDLAPRADLLPALVLDARPLASGSFDAVGLPAGGVDFGTSTGPGSGGGVGEGVGTGIGSGRGPGLGPGEGGGTGGGVYRPGGAVSMPRVISEVSPIYTSDALSRRVQGSVLLAIVVRNDGCASDIHVVRSLDPGLDEQAIIAVRQWRFAPGQLAGLAVDVAANVIVDFRIR